MPELTSLDLLIAAAAVGVAVWTNAIESAEERIEVFDNKYAKHGMRILVFFSATTLLMVFVAFAFGLHAGITSGSLGVGGIALFLVTLSISFLGIPTVISIYIDIARQIESFENVAELVSLALMFAVFAGTYFWLVTSVT